jgi:methionyl-tRNA synthetase
MHITILPLSNKKHLNANNNVSKFYITSPLYYVNDKPHLGHAFTTITVDVLARWHRLKGEKVFFLTGTDEHGEKNVKAAEEKKEDTQKYVDELAAIYKETWKKLGISNDHFIRTTDKEHVKISQEFIKKIFATGDIYKGTYEGWYCVPDETFLTDLQLVNGRCPHCGREVKKIKEEDYFFKLSKYQDRLLKLYKDNPVFLSPTNRADEIKNRVKGGLKDLCITRSAISWGISFPEDPKFTVYVWIEALCNYITALGWPDGTFDEYWPADVHMVGKEINWFHSVIWPALLMSAGIEPPKKVFAHGWWTVDGKKMSKSFGNAIDPIAISEKYSRDAFRYFLLREKPLGDDGDFSEKALIARINGELAADLGNLVFRVLTLAERFDGKISGKPELEKNLNLEKIDKLMDECDTFNALNEIWAYIRSVNKYVNDKEPWNLKGEELSNVLYNLLEACRVISIVIAPFMPDTSKEICAQLGVKSGTLMDCKFADFKGRVKKGRHLFEKVT